MGGKYGEIFFCKFRVNFSARCATPSECCRRLWFAAGNTYEQVPSCFSSRKRWNSAVSIIFKRTELNFIASPWTLSLKYFGARQMLDTWRAIFFLTVDPAGLSELEWFSIRFRLRWLDISGDIKISRDSILANLNYLSMVDNNVYLLHWHFHFFSHKRARMSDEEVEVWHSIEDLKIFPSSQRSISPFSFFSCSIIHIRWKRLL